MSVKYMIINYKTLGLQQCWPLAVWPGLAIACLAIWPRPNGQVLNFGRPKNGQKFIYINIKKK